MSEHKFIFGHGIGGAALPVKVVPRASRNEIVGVGLDGALKIRVTAPPVEGAANEAVITLLADALGLPKSNIDIVAGLTSTTKLVSIIGVDPAVVDQKFKMGSRAAPAEKRYATAAKKKPKPPKKSGKRRQ